jgi:hypothetical protein
MADEEASKMTTRTTAVDHPHDPSVMLHAPLRTVLYVDPDGETRPAVDQPSLLFDSYDKPEIADVGRELDGLLAGLITSLGGDMPPQLGTASR